MTVIAPAPGFDTLFHARRLKAAGVDEAHAEAVRDAVTEGVATKADLDNLETRLDAKIDAKIARLDAKIDAVADKLLLRLGGLIIAVGGLIVAAIKLFPSVTP